MAEIVNIDDLIPTRSFRLRGVVHEVRQLTVEEWAAKVRAEEAEKAARGDAKVGVVDAAEKMMADVASLVDGLDVAAMRALPLEALNKVWRFVNGDDLREEVEKAAAAIAEGAAGR